MISLSKKICLLGEFAVGKTSLVRRFVHNRFDDKYLSTIGVKVSSKTVAVMSARGPVELNMMIWDLAGSEEFNHVRASYLRGAAGALLVCDLTRSETLKKLSSYIHELKQIQTHIPLIIAANKVDLVDEVQISCEEVERTAEAIGAPYYLASAKLGDNVESAFRHLGQLLIA